MDRFSRGTEEPECSYELIEAIERDGVVQLLVEPSPQGGLHCFVIAMKKRNMQPS